MEKYAFKPLLLRVLQGIGGGLMVGMWHGVNPTTPNGRVALGYYGLLGAAVGAGWDVVAFVNWLRGWEAVLDEMKREITRQGRPDDRSQTRD